ncbi:MAG: hypothetical protein ACF8R9_14860 [Phycisphaerales bacterium JB054]
MNSCRPANPRRDSRHWVRGLVAALAIAALPASAAFQAAENGEADPASAAKSVPDVLAVLANPDTTAEARAEAADSILRLRPEDPVFIQATAFLATPEAAPSGDALRGPRAILSAISRTPLPPFQFFVQVAALARDAASPLSDEAIRALGSYRSRESAATLVEILSESTASERQTLAQQSLVSLSGRDDVPIGGWSAWLNEAVALPEREWQARLLAAHIRREREFESELQRTERRLADAWSRIHLLTPPDQRSAVLAQLLSHQAPALRSLGFDLVNREIGEGRQLDPSVGAATIALLEHRQPAVRAQAAHLLNRLAPAEAEGPVLAALARETDPTAADALLLTVTRWASPAAVAPTLKWLKSSPATRLRAASTAWTLYRADAITEPADRLAVLQAVREVPDDSVSAPVCRLLAALGDASDIERLRGLLTSPTPAVRGFAADALATRAEEVDTLLVAATNDAAIFEGTARALRTHRLDARGYDILTRLPSPSPAVRSRVLGEYAALLSTDDIVRLARLAADPSEAVGLLRPLLSADRAVDASQRGQLATGLLLLAQANISLNNPNDALRALTVLPRTAPDTPPASSGDASGGDGVYTNAQRLRVTLLVWLNRLDEADQIEWPAADDDAGLLADAWLDGLERAIAEPHAGVIARGIERRFAELSEAQQARLTALQQQLAATTSPDAAPVGGG